MRAYTTVKGSLHEIDRLAAMGSEPCFVLLVGEQTLSIMQDFAANEVGFLSRYAEFLAVDRYTPVEKYSVHEEFVNDIIRRFKLEVLPVNCDLFGELTRIRQTLELQVLCCEAITGGGTYEDAPPTDIVVGTGDPPAGYSDWDDYRDDLCRRAQAYVDALIAAAQNLANLSSVGVVISLALVALAFAPVALPLSALVALAAVLLSLATDEILQEFPDALTALKAELVCAIYASVTAQDAHSGLLAVINGSGYSEVLKQALAALVAYSGLNQVYDQTLTLPAGYDPDYCLECSGDCQDAEFDTGCAPGTSGFCGSGDLTPGPGRVWTGTVTASGQYRVDAKIDKMRSITVVGSSGFTPQDGANSVRVWNCNFVSQLGNWTNPDDVPDETCCACLVFVSTTPFTVTVNIEGICG